MLTRTAALALVVALAACGTTPEEERTAAAVESRDMPRSPGARPGAVDSKPVPGAAVPGGVAPSTPGAFAKPPVAGTPEKRSVYFDFDQFDIKPEYRPLVEAHAKYLRENGDARMLIQGHADERGSREYNVGLGQRRAESVQKLLVLLGAQPKQIESVSLGEEKPVCTESNEDCWWRNRRAELRYRGEY
jgi:peptidoglycan-associated lipoprotein